MNGRTIFLLVGVALMLVLGSAGVARAAPSPLPDEGTVQVDGRVSAILAVGNRVYIGGNFRHVNGVSRDFLAAVDATTGQLTGWSPRANGQVLALAASPDGTRIYAGGAFTAVNGATRDRLVAIDSSSGSVVGNWSPRANDWVRALAVAGNRLYIGGSFSAVNGQSRTRLAMVDGSTGALDGRWIPVANDTVRTLGVSGDGNRVYPGGAFSTISGRSRPFIASLDAVTGALDSSFQPPSPNGQVIALAISGTRVYTAEGGVGGAAAAYSRDTGSRAWRVLGDGDAQAIAVLGGKVYVGGHFEAFGGQTRYGLAAVDALTGALDPVWAPRVLNILSVWALTGDELRGRLYTGGDFTTVSGRPHQRFAQFSSASAM